MRIGLGAALKSYSAVVIEYLFFELSSIALSRKIQEALVPWPPEVPELFLSQSHDLSDAANRHCDGG